MRPLHSGICGTCGVPNIWAKDSVLDGDNTSLLKRVPVRGVFYEVEGIETLVKGLELGAGIPLTNIIFIAHKRAVRLFFEGTLKGVSGAAARLAAPELLIRRQAKAAPNFGVGTVSVLRYRRGKELRVGARDVWNERFFAADVAGAFEAIEQAGCEVVVDREGDELRVTVRPGGVEREDYSERFLPVTGSLMGTREYPRCHACGAPVSFQVFRWDRDRGIITERDSGMRVVHQTVACIDSIMQELVGELGEEVLDTGVRVHADYVAGKIRDGSCDPLMEDPGDIRRTFFDCLSLIRRRCLGNPIYIDMMGDELEVHIRNPASSVLLLGRVLGTYEALMRRSGRVESRVSGGLLLVRVSPD